MTQDTKKYAPEQITDFSVEVYKIRLEQPSGGGKGAVDRMLAEVGPDKLRKYAEAYDALTRAYLQAFEKLGMLR